MGYENSKIYKLQHIDGYFYIGSTYAQLRERLRKHKLKAITEPNRKVYQHINNEWEKVRILLIEEYPCENKEQLLRKEDEYIQKELNNPLCLNVLRAIIPDEERDEYNHQKNITSHHKNKEKRNAYSNEYNPIYYEKNREEIREKQRQYYLKNREKLIQKNKEYRESKSSV